MSTDSYDLIVIGGGPGGSTLSTFVAKQGHRVLVIEREQFPRYQIGESLLPPTIHGICKLLGVSDELHSAGFLRKRGGTFRWGANPEPWTFGFDEHPDHAKAGTGFAYQVERAKFDALLLANAQRNGVEVLKATVADLVVEDGTVVGVRLREEGEARTIRARFVADASGNTSSFHRQAGQRVYSEFFQNVALFGYFEGGKRLPAPNQGNILCAAFDQGWFWYIPLSDRLTSVGAVIAKEHADRIQKGQDEAMREFIDACPIIKEYLSGATRVTEGMYGRYRIRKDYSYCNTRFWAPGLVLVGDAACFIDPVFSSGVHLATYSALLAARSILTRLRGELDDERCFGEFEGRYRAEFGVFYDFLLGFYDMHQDQSSYFWRARKVLATEERANEAFIRLVAGTGTTAQDFFTMRQGAGEAVQAFVSGDPMWFQAMKQFDPRKIKRKSLVHVMAQASGKIAEDVGPAGLVPTADGMGWRDPA